MHLKIEVQDIYKAKPDRNIRENRKNPNVT